MEMSSFGGFDVFLTTSPKNKHYIAITFFEWLGRRKQLNYRRQIIIPINKLKYFIEQLQQIEITEDDNHNEVIEEDNQVSQPTGNE